MLPRVTATSSVSCQPDARITSWMSPVITTGSFSQSEVEAAERRQSQFARSSSRIRKAMKRPFGLREIRNFEGGLYRRICEWDSHLKTNSVGSPINAMGYRKNLQTQCPLTEC